MEYLALIPSVAQIVTAGLVVYAVCLAGAGAVLAWLLVNGVVTAAANHRRGRGARQYASRAAARRAAR